MSIPGKVLIALLCAACVSALWSTFSPDLTLMQLLGPSAVAAILAVALSHRAIPIPSAMNGRATKEQTADKGAGAKSRQRREKPKKSPPKPAAQEAGGERKSGGAKEAGTVKWFNGTKGFGFIIRESGEEIFVHHRSIEGEGRRGLQDGEAVRFRVVETDKGPQAEDVESAG